MKITLAYIYPESGSNGHFVEAFRFIHTYHQFPPGAAHDTLIISNGGPCDPEAAALFATLPGCRMVEHDDTGWDIGGYLAAARTVEADLMVCCGGNLYFHRAGWLARLAEARKKHGPGLYGTSASYERSPHLNTTGFACPPGELACYPYPVVTKQDRYVFEHGRANASLDLTEPDRNMNRAFWRVVYRKGMPVKLVTWDGEWDWWQWRRPPNIYRRGDQSNMLVWWKLSDAYGESTGHDQRIFSASTDTLADPDFNLAKRTFK